MPFFLFLTEAGLISLSGVMAPGPITTIVIGKGNRSPHAGALVAIGHGLVEIPLMIAIFFGVGQLLSLPYIKNGIALIGGIFLLFLAYGMLKSLQHEEIQKHTLQTSSVFAGILLTVANPYFLVWWATVGASLIARSIEFGLMGFITFAAFHWLCDFGWDYALSALSFKGSQTFGRKFQKGTILLSGLLLVFFGFKLSIDGLAGLIH